MKELLLKGLVRCEIGHQDARLGQAIVWCVQTNWVLTYGKALPCHTISWLGSGEPLTLMWGSLWAVV